MEKISTHIGWKSTQTAKYYTRTDKFLSLTKVADMLAQRTSAVDEMEMAFKRTVALRASFRFPAIRFDASTLLSFSGFTYEHAKCPPVLQGCIKGLENFPGDQIGPIECFHSRGQPLCKFVRTKESVCIRKEFNSQRIGLGDQHGRRFIVLGHQYGRCDVM